MRVKLYKVRGVGGWALRGLAHRMGVRRRGPCRPGVGRHAATQPAAAAAAPTRLAGLVSVCGRGSQCSLHDSQTSLLLARPLALWSAGQRDCVRAQEPVQPVRLQDLVLRGRRGRVRPEGRRRLHQAAGARLWRWVLGAGRKLAMRLRLPGPAVPAALAHAGPPRPAHSSCRRCACARWRATAATPGARPCSRGAAESCLLQPRVSPCACYRRGCSTAGVLPRCTGVAWRRGARALRCLTRVSCACFLLPP